MGVLRLAHVDVQVTDLDLATAYYTEVIGMLETERDETSVYLKCWDEEDHHSLRLEYAPRVGFRGFTYKVEREDDLDDLERKVTNYGFPVQRISKGESVGQGESIRFLTPTGHTMDLVHDVEKVGSALPKVNPPVFAEGLRGIAPLRHHLAARPGTFRHQLSQALQGQQTSCDARLVVCSAQSSHNVAVDDGIQCAVWPIRKSHSVRMCIDAQDGTGRTAL